MTFGFLAGVFAVFFEGIALMPFTNYLTQKFLLRLFVNRYKFKSRGIVRFLGGLGAFLFAFIIVWSSFILLPIISEEYIKVTRDALMLNVAWLIVLINIILCWIGITFILKRD